MMDIFLILLPVLTAIAEYLMSSDTGDSPCRQRGLR